MLEAGCASPILLVGGAHVDRIARADVPFRSGASHPGRSEERVGGAALNAALALRRFGATVRLLSARGGDPGAARVVAELARCGIEDHGVVWLDRATASYTAILEQTGELVAGVADMAIYDALTPRVLQRRHLRGLVAQAPVLMVDANLSEASLRHVLASATGLRAAIAVSPEKVLRLRAVLDRLDILFLSAAEASALAGSMGSPLQSIRLLRACGLRRAVVTDGPRAVTVLDDDAVFAQAPPKLERVSDVTGAGDTLAGVVLLGLANGQTLRDAIRLGLTAAALRITTGLDEHASALAHRLADDLPPPDDSIKDCAT